MGELPGVESAPAPASPYEIPADWWPTINLIWTARHRATSQRWRARARRARRLLALARSLASEAAAGRGQMLDVPDLPGRAGDVYQPVTEERRWERSAHYAEARARTVALDRSAVVAGCGQRSIGLRCGCAELHRKVLGCEQPWLCDRCRVKRFTRTRRRAVKAIQAHLTAAVASWRSVGAPRGKEPRPALLTLTCPRDVAPGGRLLSLSERRELLVTAWRKLRQWLHARIGQFPYLGMPELTPGTDGAGHLHLHFVVIWPYFDWSGADGRSLHEQWRAALGLEHATAPDVRSMGGGDAALKAARYVAKYTTKGARYTTRPGAPGLTAELVGEFVAIYYGKRRTLPSVGFWGPVSTFACKCPKCGETPVVEEWPKRLASLDPFAAWLALKRAHGVGGGRDGPWRQVAALV